MIEKLGDVEAGQELRFHSREWNERQRGLVSQAECSKLQI
jgi:hypothetical protein